MKKLTCAIEHANRGSDKILERSQQVAPGARPAVVAAVGPVLGICHAVRDESHGVLHE